MEDHRTAGRTTATGGRRRSRRAGVLLSSGGLLLLLACQDTLPTAPSDLQEGIIVYEHVDYAGQSAHLTRDVEDLKDFKGPCLEFHGDQFGGSTTEVWNDCISSVRVASGWIATLYRDDDFDGDQLIVSVDTPDLRDVPGRCDKDGFNDCVTSIRVRRQ